MIKPLLGAAALLLVLPASAQAGTASVTYTASGRFTVPAGVTQVTVLALGGHGEQNTEGTPGGRGAEVTGTLVTAPGDRLDVEIHPGAPGGGAWLWPGGSGGGAAVVRQNSNLALAAAGGGGAGGGGGLGASAGGDAGADGANASASVTGGHAGTASGPGAGGTGPTAGSPGSTFAGGAGGAGPNTLGVPGGGGGGGGAGAPGGGGGGGRGEASGGFGAGGGGGASFVQTVLVRNASTSPSSDDDAPSVTFLYAETAAPTVGLTPPADDPGTLSGKAGTDTGDLATVIVDLFRGSAATGTPALSVTATADPATGNYSAPAPPLADGTWTARARQSDAAGNTGTSLARTFTVDRTAPAVTLTSPGAFTNRTRPHFTGAAGTAAGDQPTVRVWVYSGPTASGPSLPVAVNAAGGAYAVDGNVDLADGTYTAVARQDDAFGNQGESAPLTFVVDTAAPAPTLAAPDALNPAALHGTAEDGDVTLEISRGGTVVRRLDATASGGAYSADLLALADGVYTAVATQDDAAGNHGASVPEGFMVDTTAPDIDVSAIGPVYTLGQVIPGAFTCSDAGSGVAACDGPATLDTSFGDHDVTVTARDRAGNTRTAHARYTVVAPGVQPAPKPALKITSARAKRAGRIVTVTLRGTGPGAVRATALKHSARGKLVNGAWKVTLRIKTRAKKLTVTVTSGASRVKRTVSVR